MAEFAQHTGLGGKGWRWRLIVIVVAVLAALALFSLRVARQRGGDNEFAADIATRRFAVFYLRSPLTVYLHQAAYEFVFRPLGWRADEAVAFCSALAGGIFVAALVGICSHWLFLLFNLSAPLMFLFLGHVEHYAWTNALLAVYFLAVKRHIGGRGQLWLALVWLLLAASFHMLALFFVPSFLYLLFKRDPATSRLHLAHPRREHETLLVIAIVWSLLLCAAMLTLYVGGLDNNFKRLVPFKLPSEPSRYRFALFSWDHARMWLYFNWKSSPLGLAVLLFLCWTIRERFEKFLLVATACGFLWTWLWHPDRGLLDWDLFANLAVPLNVLDGLLLARYVQARKGAVHGADA